jgi:hypothetical protein
MSKTLKSLAIEYPRLLKASELNGRGSRFLRRYFLFEKKSSEKNAKRNQ